MNKMNLLPWRQKRRAQAIHEWRIYLVVMLVLSIGVLFYLRYVIHQDIIKQRLDNQRLRAAIASMANVEKEMKGLTTKHTQLLRQITNLEEIEQTNHRLGHLFKDMVGMMPMGISLTEIHRHQSVITLKGVTDSAVHLSQWMNELTHHHGISKSGLPQRKTGSSNMEEFSLRVFLKEGSNE